MNPRTFIILLYLSCFHGIVSTDTVVTSFIDWFRENEGHINKIDIVNLEGYGRGVVAQEVIKKGEVVLAIPPKLYIDINKVESSYLANALPNESLMHLFSLYILNERRDLESFYKPYIDILPKSLNTTLFFNDLDIESLQSSHLKEYTITRNQAVEHHFNRILLQQTENPLLHWLSNVTLNEFKWALSIGWSRSFKLAQPYRSGFVPFGDMFNMLAPNQTPMVKQKFVDGTFVFEAIRDIAVHEQIFTTYSKGLSNAQLLMDYGFMFKDNPFDFVLIESPLHPNVKSFNEKLQLATAAQCDESQIFLSIERGIEKLICATQITYMTSKDLGNPSIRQTISSSSSVSLLTTKSQKTLSKVAEILVDKYESYGTTIEDDFLQLKTEAMNANVRAAMELRIKEKDILQRAYRTIISLLESAQKGT